MDEKNEVQHTLECRESDVDVVTLGELPIRRKSHHHPARPVIESGSEVIGSIRITPASMARSCNLDFRYAATTRRLNSLSVAPGNCCISWHRIAIDVGARHSGVARFPSGHDG